MSHFELKTGDVVTGEYLRAAQRLIETEGLTWRLNIEVLRQMRFPDGTMCVLQAHVKSVELVRLIMPEANTA